MRGRKKTGGPMDLLMRNKAFFILAVLVAVASCVSPVFLTGANLMNVVRQVCPSAIIGIGFTLVVASGCIDLSVGSLIALVGVVAALVSKQEGMPLVVAMLAAAAVGVACELANAALVNVFNLPSFIVTLAMMSVFKGATYLITGNAPITRIPESFVEIGQGYAGVVPIPVCVMAGVAALGYVVIGKTVFGRHAVAIGGNAEAAKVCGVDLANTRYGVYAMMGVCVAIAATLLTGRAASAQVAAGSGMEMDAVAAVVIGGTPLSGGIANVAGTIFGCLLIGVINNMLNIANVNSNWQLIAKGLLIILAIVLDVQSTKLGARIAKKEKATEGKAAI